MSKAEICRAISEKLEPSSNLARRTYKNMADYSPLGFWFNFTDAGWTANNFFTSEDASARLRTAIRKQFKYVAVCYQRQGETTNTDQIEFEFSESIDDKPGIYWLYKGSDELEAWALAAAEWLKIEVGELTN